MKINVHLLPILASEFYQEGDNKILKRRMNDQVTKALKNELQDAEGEYSEYLKKINELTRKHSTKKEPASFMIFKEKEVYISISISFYLDVYILQTILFSNTQPSGLYVRKKCKITAFFSVRTQLYLRYFANNFVISQLFSDEVQLRWLSTTTSIFLQIQFSSFFHMFILDMHSTCI